MSQKEYSKIGRTCIECNKESVVAIADPLGAGYTYYCEEHRPNKVESPEFPSEKFKEFSKQSDEERAIDAADDLRKSDKEGN